MPYSKVDQVPQSLRSALNDNLVLINAWAGFYDEAKKKPGNEQPGAIAWAIFKKVYKKVGETWVKKKREA